MRDFNEEMERLKKLRGKGKRERKPRATDSSWIPRRPLINKKIFFNFFHLFKFVKNKN